MSILKIFFFSTFFCASSAYALTIKNLTLHMEESKEKVVEEVINNEGIAQMITLSVTRVDSPYTMNAINPDHEGEILFTPSRLMLPREGKARISFTYNGPKDGKERYYSIHWSAEPIRPKTAQTVDKQLAANVGLSLRTILLVSPRQSNFQYEFDGKEFKNTGNASIATIAHSLCKQQPANKKDEICEQIKWVAPGASTSFPRLDTTSNKFSLGYWRGDDFVQINKTSGKSQ